MAVRLAGVYGSGDNRGNAVEYLILAGLLYVGYRIWKARGQFPRGPAANASEAASSEMFAL